MKNYHYSSGRNGTFLQVCGLWFARNPFGNCFSPAVILDTRCWGAKPVATSTGLRRPARALFTFRHRCAETTIYWRGGLRFDWNSGHLARRFGQFVDNDFGGLHHWRGHFHL